MSFRLIPFRYFSAAVNMALDEAILENIRAGLSKPTIRFYGWEPSAVSIGYFQGLGYEVNEEECRKEGVDVVRRITGGGAVYHDRNGEITYSILGPLDLFPTNVAQSYQQVCDDVVFALQSLGIPAQFEPVNDILVGEQKISGNAQTRRGGQFLQHGTILYRVDVEKMFRLLTVDPVKITDKLIRSVRKRVTSVTDCKPVSFDELAKALELGFSRNREVEYGDYSPAELERAQELAETRYGTREWIAMR
jgi:lipoate-protein ligase A